MARASQQRSKLNSIVCWSSSSLKTVAFSMMLWCNRIEVSAEIDVDDAVLSWNRQSHVPCVGITKHESGIFNQFRPAGSCCLIRKHAQMAYTYYLYGAPNMEMRNINNSYSLTLLFIQIRLYRRCRITRIGLDVAIYLLIWISLLMVRLFIKICSQICAEFDDFWACGLHMQNHISSSSVPFSPTLPRLQNANYDPKISAIPCSHLFHHFLPTLERVHNSKIYLRVFIQWYMI